jgi:hypothetical protein
MRVPFKVILTPSAGWIPSGGITNFIGTKTFTKINGSATDVLRLTVTFTESTFFETVIYDFSNKHVTLSLGGGVSSAIINAVQADEITAHAIQGYQDDTSGSITGSATALIQYPNHIMQHLTKTYMGVNSTSTSYFTTVGSSFAAHGYQYSVLINEYKKAREWLMEMAKECRCYFRTYNGQLQLIWRPDTATSDKTITSLMVKRSKDNTSSMTIERTQLSDVVNKINLRYSRDWTKTGDEAYAGLASTQDAGSIIKYGEKEDKSYFTFDFVNNPTMAEELALFYLNRMKERRKSITFKTFLDNAELEFSDMITIEPSGSAICEIEKVNLHPGNGMDNRSDEIEIVAREYGT